MLSHIRCPDLDSFPFNNHFLKNLIKVSFYADIFFITCLPWLKTFQFYVLENDSLSLIVLSKYLVYVWLSNSSVVEHSKIGDIYFI